MLWCNSAVHHEPRHEDGMPNSGPRSGRFDDAWEGSALVMWSGFDLRPRNLFDRTPFYPYPPAPRGPSPTSRVFPNRRTTQPGATAVEPPRTNREPERRMKSPRTRDSDFLFDCLFTAARIPQPIDKRQTG